MLADLVKLDPKRVEPSREVPNEAFASSFLSHNSNQKSGSSDAIASDGGSNWRTWDSTITSEG